VASESSLSSATKKVNSIKKRLKPLNPLLWLALDKIEKRLDGG
jgi:hypothetical protein